MGPEPNFLYSDTHFIMTTLIGFLTNLRPLQNSKNLIIQVVFFVYEAHPNDNYK